MIQAELVGGPLDGQTYSFAEGKLEVPFPYQRESDSKFGYALYVHAGRERGGYALYDFEGLHDPSEWKGDPQ